MSCQKGKKNFIPSLLVQTGCTKADLKTFDLVGQLSHIEEVLWELGNPFFSFTVTSFSNFTVKAVGMLWSEVDERLLPWWKEAVMLSPALWTRLCAPLCANLDSVFRKQKDCFQIVATNMYAPTYYGGGSSAVWLTTVSWHTECQHYRAVWRRERSRLKKQDSL